MTKAMVLAAGVGSRLEPISHFIPKPLVPVLNKPVICHILSALKRQGISEVVANTHYHAQMLTDYFRQKPLADMELQFRFEQELTGDAGGVRACRDFFDSGTFLVIMGDLITNADINKLIKAHKSKGALATIGVKSMQDVTRFGVMSRDKNGFIKAFQEKPKAEEAISNEISTGIYILEPEIFDYIPATGAYGFGRQLFPSLVSQGLPVLGQDIAAYWSDIGTLADLFGANMDALAGKIPLCQLPEHNNEAYQDLGLGKEVMIGSRVKIERSASIGERCIIGDGCSIGKNARLENCIVFADSQVEPGAVLTDCIFAFNEIIPVDSRIAAAGALDHS